MGHLRFILVSAIILVFYTCAQKNPFGFGTKIIPPEVLKDSSVVFRLNSPDGQSIALQGSWMKFNEKLPLIEDSTDIWSVIKEPLDPSMYHYNILIDGVDKDAKILNLLCRLSSKFVTRFIIKMIKKSLETIS